MSDERDHARRLNAVFRQIQEAIAGHSQTIVVQALMHSLVVAIGVYAPNLPRAEASINALPAELLPLLQKQWPKFRRHRVKAAAAARAHEAARTPTNDNADAS